MLSLLTYLEILKKIIAYCICTTRDRLEHSTTSYTYIKCLDIKILLCKHVKDNFLSEVLLLNDKVEARKFLCCVS